MKRKLIVCLLSLCLLVLGAAPSFANEEPKLNGKIMKSKVAPKAVKNIFGTTYNLKDINENLPVESLDYKLNFKDTEDGMVEVTFNGSFKINGKKAKFKSDGKVKKYELDGEETLFFGSLTGIIKIDEMERDITVGIERFKNNLYFAITINRLGNEEGYLVIKFGDSILTEDIIENTIKARKITVSSIDEEPKYSINGIWYREDTDWAAIDQYGTLGLRAALYLSDDIVDDSNDGPVVTTVHIDKDDIATVVGNDWGSDTVYVRCDFFRAEWSLPDEESSFGNHTPNEEETSSTIVNTLAAILSDIYKIPVATFTALLSGIDNNITVLNETYMYSRIFRIYPENEEIMDFSQNPDGGYPLRIHIEKQTATDDDLYVEVDATLYINVIGQTWFTLGTETATVHADLADY